MNRVRFDILALAFVSTLFMRVWGITRNFWLLGDQIRDWTIALSPWSQLPLAGPSLESGGHTAGPLFYWGLWLIRVTVGPWFENLPHAGGIGQAILQSAADTLLLAGVWRRSGSPWLALAATALISTAPYDLSLSATISSTMMGLALVKIAVALVILGWPERSSLGVGLAAAAAWGAVQCDMWTVFAAGGVFAALLAAPLGAGDQAALRRAAWIIAVTVAILQVPHVVHQIPAGEQNTLHWVARPRLARSWLGFSSAFGLLETSPWPVPASAWLVVGCSLVVALKYRRDTTLLAVTLLPQVAAFVGYAMYVGDLLDHDHYVSLMPAAVLTILLAAAAVPSKQLARVLSVGMLALSIAVIPVRLRFAMTLNRLPAYGLLLDGSRKIVRLNQAMRSIRAELSLPPSTDPEFLYTVLGGRIDRESGWVALIKPDGAVVYRRNGGV